MTITFAQYEHNTIGFPKIKLKWTEENGEFSPAYITIQGIIQKGTWKWRNPYPKSFIAYELEQFDKYIREKYSDDITVQG